MSLKPDDLQRAHRQAPARARNQRGNPAAGADSDVPVIDLEHLRGFTGGNAELEQEVATLFLTTAEDYLERMGLALKVDDGWSEAAHALKGASANLGAARVAMLAAAAEGTAPNADAVTALRRAIGEVRAFFERGQD